ncbi:MAG: sugar transferase [Oscillospiraceae bacterium]
MQKNYYKFKKTIMVLMSAAIFFLLVLAFAYVWYTDYNYNILTGAPFFTRRGNWLIIALYGLMHLFFTKIYGGYKIGYYKMSNIIYSQMLSTFLVNVLVYFEICLIGKVMVSIAPIIKLTAIDVALVIMWTYVVTKIYEHIFPPRKLLIIYSNHNATNLIRKMSQRSDKYQICEAINIEEGMELIKTRIDKYDGAIICDAPSKVRNDILKYCFETSKRTYITPKISDIIIRGADELNLFDTPILLCRNRGLSIEQRFLKRITDIVFSLLALIVLSPFLILIAIAIKLYDKGPVFFTQERVTVNGKKFKIYKFRSMIVNAEAEGISIPATDNDPRITPIGKFIRKIRFDEFPQLINIIKGDMSIVGPRPERTEHVEEYIKEMPEFKYRTKVKAGLTGYAQVYGKYNTTAYDKLKLDMMYIENYSLRLDFQLIIMTVKVLFMKESTEGFEQGEHMG